MEGSKIDTVEEFVVAVNGRFRSAVDADVAAEKLNRLRQRQGQTVAAYAGVVHQLLLRIPDMAMSDRVRAFARGLLPNLAQKVREVRPRTMEEATELAIRYEGSFGLPGSPKKEKGSGSGRSINSILATRGETEGDESSQQESRAERKLDLLIAAMQKWQPEGGGTEGQARQQLGAGRRREYCFRCGSASQE